MSRQLQVVTPSTRIELAIQALDEHRTHETFLYEERIRAQGLY